MAGTHDIPELDAGGLRHFAFSTATVVVLLFGLALPWLLGFEWPKWPWIFAAVFGIWGLAAPASLRGIYHAWMRFGLLLNRITTPIVLGLVFCLLFVPVALIMRVIGRDTMARRIDSGQLSYRVSSIDRPKDSLKKPF